MHKQAKADAAHTVDKGAYIRVPASIQTHAMI